MNNIKSENKLCLICMEEHEVHTVIVVEFESYKGEDISFNATYEYCDTADEYLETEDMIKSNSLAMKDAYRQRKGLLTSDEIVRIRERFGVSQKDFSEILDWGKATITRYENHQVQDRAHDDILRKIGSDPKWFIEMLDRSERKISERANNKYRQTANKAFSMMKNEYIVDSIQSLYANYSDELVTGGVKLDLNKVIEIINYYAENVESLHKAKVMKMLWYCDSLSYKRRGKSITGIVYSALPVGAVPQGSDQIFDLDGIGFETVIHDNECMNHKFHPVEGFRVKDLTEDDIRILDVVIDKVGHLNSQEILERLNNEDAFKYTNRSSIIPYSYANNLSLN